MMRDEGCEYESPLPLTAEWLQEQVNDGWNWITRSHHVWLELEHWVSHFMVVVHHGWTTRGFARGVPEALFSQRSVGSK